MLLILGIYKKLNEFSRAILLLLRGNGHAKCSVVWCSVAVIGVGPVESRAASDRFPFNSATSSRFFHPSSSVLCLVYFPSIETIATWASSVASSS
jgi:hypothetical protein